MAITYEWEVLSLKKTNLNDLSDVIIGTKWKCTGTDEFGNSGHFIGATPFLASEVDPNNFIDFDNLTEELVLSWIQARVDYQDRINEKILTDISQKKNPVVEVEQLPWQSNTSNLMSEG